MKEFVDYLTEWLEKNPDLTEAGLAKSAGLDNSTIRQMIKFRRSPRIDTARKICAALGVSIEDVMGGAPRPAYERQALRLLAQLDDNERSRVLGYGEGLVARRHEEAPE